MFDRWESGIGDFCFAWKRGLHRDLGFSLVELPEEPRYGGSVKFIFNELVLS